jgi:hypothetical protein
MATRGERRHNDVAALRFSGGRYEAVGFPLDGIDELQKYQRLVVEAAKKIWFEKYPDAVRLPPHFADRVRLRLTEVDKGSVVPVLERETQIAFPDIPDLLELSIDYVDETFDSMVARLQLPGDITEGMASVAKLFGVSFLGNEKATFRDGTGSPILYTVERRQAFLGALKANQEAVVGTLIGSIGMLNATKEFTLVDGGGNVIKGDFSNATIFDDLHEVHKLREKADLVWLVCSYLINREDGSVVKINDVEDAGLFAKSSNRWAGPVSELAVLGDGWLDGEGKRIALTPLAAALDVLGSIDELSLEEPSIFADTEGGVRLEWLTSNSHTVLSVGDDAKFSGYHLNISDGGEDSVEGVVGKSQALDFVRGYIGG